jgi:hypothetical protein
MRKTLILIVVLLLVTAPLLTSAVPAICGGADVACATAVEGGDDDEAMSLWDWLVVLWSTYWDEWPV